MSEDDRKLFIGGLHSQATEDDLKEHFGKFGEIQSCSLKFDQQTGRSRGFAFITFADLEGVNKALQEGTHTIKGKSVESKLAKPKQNKVFVGGVERTASEDDIKSAFQERGFTVTEVFLPHDQETGQNKGYSFVTFGGDDTAASQLLQEGHNSITIKGKESEIKRAKNKNDQGRGGFQGGRGGRGRGGYGGGGGYDMYGGYGGGGYGQYGGGFGGYGGYPQGGYGGYDQSGYGGGYGGGGYGGYGGGGGGYGGHDQYKMKAGRGQGYKPY